MQDVRWKVPGWKEGTGDKELWYEQDHQEEHQRGSGAWSLAQGRHGQDRGLKVGEGGLIRTQKTRQEAPPP